MSKSLNTKPARPPGRGFLGRGGGAWTRLEPAPEWRGTSHQVCGLFPFSVGSPAPLVGTPLGPHLATGDAVCADPISWFSAGLISNPSMFLLSKPGIGKSTLAMRMLAGASAMGHIPLVLGDLRPDYTHGMEALGGQVNRVGGGGRGILNLLDPGHSAKAAAHIGGVAGEALAADAALRRLDLIVALLTVWRGTSPDRMHRAALERALAVLDERHAGPMPPILEDILTVLDDAPPSVMAVTGAATEAEYAREIKALRVDLISLASGAAFGDMFNGQTTSEMDLDRPAVYDVSGTYRSDSSRQAAALLASWTFGFASVEVSNALADAGLGPQRHYLLVLDELWRALRVGHGLVDQIDGLTRLNRNDAVGQIFISHTTKDLRSLSDRAEIEKAKGFVERSGMVVVGALPDSEFAPENLGSILDFSDAERQLVTSWVSPEGWGGNGSQAPPGRGKFLIKVGNRPGIPFVARLTRAEASLRNTNHRWAQLQPSGGRAR